MVEGHITVICPVFCAGINSARYVSPAPYDRIGNPRGIVVLHVATPTPPPLRDCQFDGVLHVEVKPEAVADA